MPNGARARKLKNKPRGNIEEAESAVSFLSEQTNNNREKKGQRRKVRCSLAMLKGGPRLLVKCERASTVAKRECSSR